MKEKYIHVRCDCWCCMIEFMRTDWDDGDVCYNISVLDSRYDHNVNGIWNRLRRAFGVLVGKPVSFNDVLLNQERFDQLVDSLQELREG